VTRLESPGHRTALLDETIDEVGIGIEVVLDGRDAITQDVRRHVGS